MPERLDEDKFTDAEVPKDFSGIARAGKHSALRTDGQGWPNPEKSGISPHQFVKPPL
jgi:hypothetical protein